MNKYKLAFRGGEKSVKDIPADVLAWPIITKEDEDAILDVVRRGAMSGLDVTEKFEKEFALWQGTEYGICFNNGTLSLEAAMFACNLGEGDEIICPSKTYWASCIQALKLGASVVFADIEDTSLCLDPKELERCVSPRTKVIMVVHYIGHPADMDAIMAFAKPRNIKVIEDVSHAQGGLYKGRKLGSIGDVGAMSLMSSKSFATGELGILVTNDKEIHDRAMAYSHYERNNSKYISTDYLLKYPSMPLGGIKGRANQTCTAMGRVQLKYYDERCAEIRKAMNLFFDIVESKNRGLKGFRVDESTGSNMAGFYFPHMFYNPEAFDGLPLSRFCEALSAEGVSSYPGANFALHTHNIFKTADIYNSGKPTRIRFADRDVRGLDPVNSVSENIQILSVPWIKKYNVKAIETYANAFLKVAENYKELFDPDLKKDNSMGRWFFYNDKE